MAEKARPCWHVSVDDGHCWGTWIPDSILMGLWKTDMAITAPGRVLKQHGARSPPLRQ